MNTRMRSDANETVIALNQMLENMDNLLHSSQSDDRRQKLLALEQKQRELQQLCESALAAEQEKANDHQDFSERSALVITRPAGSMQEEDMNQYAQRCAEQLDALAQECRAASEQVQATRRENDALNNVNQQLTTKVECLARHLVKAIKERNALEAQADQYLEMLEAAQYELKQRPSTSPPVVTATFSVTPVGTSQNVELAHAHSELERLNNLLVSQQAENTKRRQALLVSHEQQMSEVKCEVADAEGRANELTLVAQSAEQMTEKLADELETALHHIRSLDEALQKNEAALVAERRRSTMALAEQSRHETGVSEWPLAARLEVARLRAHFEATSQQAAAENRHLEARLSTVTTSCESAQVRCAELEHSLATQNQLLQSSLREKAAVEVRALRLQQQLRDIRHDAADVEAILSKTKADVEFAVLSATDDHHLNVAKQLQS